MNLISFLQRDVILQHEIHQLNEYDLIIDAMKTTLDNSLIGRWISISWRRQTETLDFFAFDVGYISSIIENIVQIHFNEAAKSYDVPLKSSNWTKCVKVPPSRQYQW